MPKQLKELKVSLDNHITSKLSNMNKLNKLYDEVGKLQAQVDDLNLKMTSANIEITTILNGMKDIENEINSTMQNISSHSDFA